MSKRMPVPADLEHLIEKREDDNDRRAAIGGKRPARPQVANRPHGPSGVSKQIAGKSRGGSRALNC